MKRPTWFLLGILLLGKVWAASTVHMPDWVCNGSNTLFRSGFQDGERVPHDASLGSGGAYPLKQIRQVSVPGLAGGVHNYYIFIPVSYDPRQASPLLVILHGTAPNADSYAQSALADWSDISVLYTKGVIIVAPVASDGSSWSTPASATPSDYDLFNAVLADVEAHYNVERRRRYVWGFSAGAHVAHDLIINGAASSLNESNVAGYAVSAGRLMSLACFGLSDAACRSRLALLPRKVPLDIHIGKSDPLYAPPYDASLDSGRFQSQGWVLQQSLWSVAFVGGHTYERGQLATMWAELCPFAVEP